MIYGTSSEVLFAILRYTADFHPIFYLTCKGECLILELPEVKPSEVADLKVCYHCLLSKFTALSLCTLLDLSSHFDCGVCTLAVKVTSLSQEVPMF